jgi:peptide deformylase
VQKLIDDMIDTMAEYHGVGLAAPQVHEGVRIFVAAARTMATSETARWSRWRSSTRDHRRRQPMWSRTGKGA